MLSATATYRLYAGNLQASLERTAQKPIVSRETEYYKANIVNVKSIDDFLNDDRLYNYAMKAHGLEDMTYAKAFMRKALTEGIDNPRSFANTLSDPRYRDFVGTYNFARHGPVAMAFDKAQQGTVDLYARQVLEEDAGTQNEGTRLALYFARKAPTIESPYEILASKALSEVVRTALGLSDATAVADIDKQVEMIRSRLDIEDFKDPEKLSKFIDRFNSLWELKNGQSTQNIPALLISSSPASGISSNLLMTLQNLKLGGV